MSKWKLIGIAGGLIFIGLIYWTIISVPEPPPPVTPEDRPLIMTYDGNTLSEEKDGKKIWELTADKISVNIETQDMFLDNIRAVFYAKDGRGVKVVAKEGKYDNKTQDVSLSGDVKATTSDGAELTSKELLWLAEKELLSALGDVRATKDDMEATGDRMDSFDGFNRIRIEGKAHLARGVKKDGETQNG